MPNDLNLCYLCGAPPMVERGHWEGAGRIAGYIAGRETRTNAIITIDTSGLVCYNKHVGDELRHHRNSISPTTPPATPQPLYWAVF